MTKYRAGFATRPGTKAWFSYVANDQRLIVGTHSSKKITKDFTHE